MKSAVVDESLSSYKPMYCSREYQTSTRLNQQYEKSTLKRQIVWGYWSLVPPPSVKSEGLQTLHGMNPGRHPACLLSLIGKQTLFVEAFVWSFVLAYLPRHQQQQDFPHFWGVECVPETLGSKGLMGIYLYSSPSSRTLSCRSLLTI